MNYIVVKFINDVKALATSNDIREAKKRAKEIIEDLLESNLLICEVNPENPAIRKYICTVS